MTALHAVAMPLPVGVVLAVSIRTGYAMRYFLTGAGLLALILGLFWLKDELRSPRLARLAYSELTMRLAVVAAGLMLVGVVMVAGQIWQWIAR